MAIYLIIGVILKATRVIGDRASKKFTHVIFVTLFPFMMFDNLYGRDLHEYLNAKLSIYAAVIILVQIAISCYAVGKVENEDRNKGVMIQALFRGNFVLMGFPIAANLFGKDNIAPVAVLMFVVVPLYNVASVIVLERFRGGRADLKTTFMHLATNPIIEGGVAALIVMALGIKLPPIVENTITDLADCTTPIALILLGSSLSFNAFKSDRNKIAFCVIGKLLVFPAMGIGGAVLLGFEGVSLIAITIMEATPVAVASYAMAASLGGNGRLAGELVVITTALSCFTMPIWLFVLKTAGLF